MKKFIILLILSLRLYANDLEHGYKYQHAIEEYKIEQNRTKAKIELEDVLSSMSSDHPLFNDVYASYLEVSDVKTSDELKNAISFATGRKEEAYCKDIGLVFLKAFHNDNSISRVFLTDNNRHLEQDSYSIIESGNWMYQLGNAYRKPMKSELWINSANSSHFDMEELRKTKKGRDQGKWTASWKAGSFMNSFHSSGSVKEPIPMYMANDYHAWGTPDLGYQIVFKVGDTQEFTTKESTFNHGRIILKSTRTVISQHNIFKTRDFDHKLKVYKNCYLVETKIKFAGISNK